MRPTGLLTLPLSGLLLSGLLLSGLPAGRAAAQPVWNVAREGNHQPGDDITATLQRGLHTQHEHGLPVYVPHGWWYVSDTVSQSQPRRAGGHLLGAGMAQPTGGGDHGHPWLRGLQTRLIWKGPVEKPMLLVNGTELRISDLSFFAKTHQQASAPQQVCLLVSKNGTGGLGTGKMIIERCNWFDFATAAIQNGATPEEPNCETNTYRNVEVIRCGSFLRLVNAQGMGHYVDGLRSDSHTGCLFDVYGGGMIHARNLLTMTVVLRLQANNPRRYSPGPANATFTFTNCKVDAQASEHFQAVEMVDPVYADIVFNTGRISDQKFGTNGGKFATLQGAASLTVRDWVGDLHGAISGKPDHKGRLPNVLLDRCRLWSAPDEIGVGEFAAFGTRDCYGWGAQPLPDQPPAE